MIELPIAAGRGMPSVHSVAAQVAYDAATGQLRRLATGRPVTTRQAHGYIVIRAQGIGAETANMRSLLAFAFVAGWQAHKRADFDAIVRDALEAPKLRRAALAAIDLLHEAAK